MALIKCSECGKEISSNAKTCPNCGNPMFTKEEKQAEKNKNLLIKLVLGLIISSILISIIYFISIGFLEAKKGNDLLNKSQEVQEKNRQAEELEKEKEQQYKNSIYNYK